MKSKRSEGMIRTIMIVKVEVKRKRRQIYKPVPNCYLGETYVVQFPRSPVSVFARGYYAFALFLPPLEGVECIQYIIFFP